MEFKFFSPPAAKWDIQVWAADPKELVLEMAKKIVIVEFKTNNALTFTTKEMWEEFTSWFAAQRRKKRSVIDCRYSAMVYTYTCSR